MERLGTSRTALVAMFLAMAQLGANCMDGYTPDCSRPDSQCGAIELDGSLIDTGAPEAASDAPSDATIDDAGDASDARDAPDGG